MKAEELGAKLVELLQGAAMIDRAELTREESMASMYGEAITRTKAGELLNCERHKVNDYVQRGLIRTCCEGDKIDTRSIASFLETHSVNDRRRRGARKKEDWMV